MADPTKSPPQPVRKRRRPAVVCAECRRRKIACDRKSPCGQCALHNVECVYVTGSVAPAYGRPLRPQTALNSGRGHSQLGDGTGVVSAMANANLSPNTAYAAGTGTSSSQDNSTAGATTVSGSPLDDDDDGDPVAGSSQQPLSQFGGRLAKSRLFGRSHWMNNMDEFKDVHSLTHLVHFVSGSPIYKSIRTSKRIARIIKAEEMRRVAAVAADHNNTSQNNKGTDDMEAWFQVPPRTIADRLVDLYFNVFEAQFRILHIPTFRREYETYMDNLSTRHSRGDKASITADQADQAHQMFMVKLVLVLALGSCFYDNVEDPAAAATMHGDLRIAAVRAVTLHHNHAEYAYCVPLDKHRLSLDTLQIYCLVTVARQTAALGLGDDMIWFSAGGLLHTALGMGLNRDPSYFKSLSFAQAEMRRRLWATILELVVQTSLDQGMPPLIRPDDYDCAPPLNLNDDEFVLEDAPGHNDNRSDNQNDKTHRNPLNIQLPIHCHSNEKKFYPAPPSSSAKCSSSSNSSSSVVPPKASQRKSTTTNSKGHPDSEFTQTSMQRLLYRSLPTRLKIVKALNGLGACLTYERALQLSQELLEACRYTAPVLRAAPLNSNLSGGGVSAAAAAQQPIPEAERAAFAKLRIAFYELLTRRFHHSLHSPFARMAVENVQFYFSRRARVETVLRLLSFFRPASSLTALDGSPGVLADFNTPIKSDAPVSEASHHHPSGIPMSLVRPTAAEDPCRRLWMIGRGMLKCIMVDILATAVIELIHQLQEDHYVPGSDLTLSQRELYDTVRTVMDLSYARLEAGETNVKSFLFFRGALAQVDALMTGKPVRQAIVEATQAASENTTRTLKGVAARRGIVLPADIDDEDDEQRNTAKGTSTFGHPPTVAPVVLQTGVSAPASVPNQQNTYAEASGSQSQMAPALAPPRLPTGYSFGSFMGSNNDIGTPSQILGMVDMTTPGAGLGAAVVDAAMTDTGHGRADVDSAIHLSSAATTELSSGASGADSSGLGHLGVIESLGNSDQEWVDNWIMDPESGFGLDNWFFPYNDPIDYS